MSLAKLRRAIRLGFVDDAEKLLTTVNVSDATLGRAALKLLRFEEPTIPETASTAESEISLLVLKAEHLNRLRDPLRALALLSDAGEKALALRDVSFRVDVLFETARVYNWLGNEKLSAENLTEVLSLDVETPIRFLTLFRLGNLYAEVERFVMAQRYLRLAQALSKGMERSVFYAQFQECSARVDLALGGDGAVQREWLDKNAQKLPTYLKFRASVLDIELALQKQDAAKVQLLLEQTSSQKNDGHGAFEVQLRNVFSARLDLLRQQPETATQKLKTARDWFADEDLAIRVVQVRILLAQAYVMQGAADVAALELDQARSYCASRGMILQQEKVERAFAELDLALNPVIENNRNSAEGAWKDGQAYVLIKRLGEGGQANVYLAHDNARNRKVAYKKLKGADLAALSREVRMANAAQVLGVAKILACGTGADGSLYMVQEFVEGTSLRKLIDANQAQFSYAEQLHEILIALHKANIVHGDVKPENVIVNDQGEVTLVDFGLAQTVGTKSQGATPRYAAPSWPAYFAKATWRDDYALGLVMIECCGAVLPERHNSIVDLLRISPAVKNAIRPFPNDVQKTILNLLRPF